jgi:uncharacterized protein
MGSTLRRVARLVLGSATLGLGVALLLNAHLGSDGYSTLLQGTSVFFDVRFVVTAVGVAAAFVAIGWARGLKPGWGTVVQPFVVGTVVTLATPLVPEPEQLLWRAAQFALGFLVLCLGVAAYLSSDYGIGPGEVLARAWDPPFPFKWSYSVIQAACALVGWRLGADLGAGTVLAAIVIGPVVNQFSRIFPAPDPGERDRGAHAGT